MATRAREENLWDIIRDLERRIKTLETGTSMDWEIPVLLNGWVDFGGSYTGARYRRLSNGQVEIQGLVKSGTPSSTTSGDVFILPVGYRPSGTLTYATNSTNAFGRFDVFSDGRVRAYSGTGGYFSLNCTFTPIAA